MDTDINNLPELVRNNCRIKWIAIQGEENNEGFQLLRFCSYAKVDEEWVPIKDGSVLTQTRANEDPEIIKVLLEKLADRIEPLMSKIEVSENSFEIDLGSEGSELFNKMRWFGPEFAEEY